MTRTNKVLSIPILTVALALVSGCAPMMWKAPPRAPAESFNDTESFAASYDSAWRGLVATLAEDETPFALIEKESGIVTTRLIILHDGYGAGDVLKSIARAPRCPLCGWGAARYSMTVYVVRKAEAETSIRVVTQIEGWSDMSGWKRWESAGVLERKLLERIRGKL